MPLSNSASEKQLKIVWPIVYAGGVIGLILSWSVLSGDQLGRINLFYLLVVYLLIPLFSIIASVTSLLFGNGINLARVITAIPLWSFKTKTLIRKAQQLNLDKYWFLMQSQAAAIAFSLASLVVFFALLLATDLNFVWRSTILEPSDILPFLETVAWPWSFWNSAQPNLLLLEMTQDSRIVATNSGFSGYGAWWQFILATQLCYSLLLRIVLMFVTRCWLKNTMKSDIEQTLQTQISQHSPLNTDVPETSPILHQIPDKIKVNNWDSIPIKTLGLLTQLDITEDNLLVNNRQDSQQQLYWQNEQLIIVKAWEGPLGELEDFLQNGQGYLLPLDWNESGLIKLQLNHLHEWQRLINKFPRWQLYLPKELVPV